MLRSDFFVYDDYMNPGVMVSAGFKPRWMEPARLEGFTLAPAAKGFTLLPSARSVYGALVCVSPADARKFIEKNAGLEQMDAVCTLLADRRQASCTVFIALDAAVDWDQDAVANLARYCAEWHHPKRYVGWLIRAAKT